MTGWQYILGCMIVSLPLSGCSDKTTGTSSPAPTPVSVLVSLPLPVPIHSEAVDVSDKLAPLEGLLAVGCQYQIIDRRRGGELSCQEKANAIDNYIQYKAIAQFYHGVDALMDEKSHHFEVREKLTLKHGAAAHFLYGNGKVNWTDYYKRRQEILSTARDIEHFESLQISNLQQKESLLESGMWIGLRFLALYAQVYLNFENDQVSLEVGKIYNHELFLSFMKFFKAEIDVLKAGSQSLCHQVFETLNQLGSN